MFLVATWSQVAVKDLTNTVSVPGFTNWAFNTATDVYLGVYFRINSYILFRVKINQNLFYKLFASHNLNFMLLI
jgi:hypothetical protein